MPDATVRNRLLGSVGALQSIFGESQEAFNAINKIDDASVREHSLLSLAVSQTVVAGRNAAEGDYAAGRKAISLARRAVENVRPRGHGADAMIITAIKEQSPEEWEVEARMGAGDSAAGVWNSPPRSERSRCRDLSLCRSMRPSLSNRTTSPGSCAEGRTAST